MHQGLLNNAAAKGLTGTYKIPNENEVPGFSFQRTWAYLNALRIFFLALHRPTATDVLPTHPRTVTLRLHSSGSAVETPAVSLDIRIHSMSRIMAFLVPKRMYTMQVSHTRDKESDFAPGNPSVSGNVLEQMEMQMGLQASSKCFKSSRNHDLSPSNTRTHDHLKASLNQLYDSKSYV